MAPVSCLIWVSRRSRRTIKSDTCATRPFWAGGPAGGAVRSPPPNRSLPPKRLSRNPGCVRSASWADAAQAEAAMMAAAIAGITIRRSLMQVIGPEPGRFQPALAYESVRPNCDFAPQWNLRISPSARRQGGLECTQNRRHALARRDRVADDRDLLSGPRQTPDAGAGWGAGTVVEPIAECWRGKNAAQTGPAAG